MKTVDDLKHAFQPVSPNSMDAGQRQRLMTLQNRAQEFAEDILDLVPDCADRTHALRLVLDSKFWGVQAITHHGPTIAAQGKAPQQAKAPQGQEQGPSAKEVKSEARN